MKIVQNHVYSEQKAYSLYNYRSFVRGLTRTFAPKTYQVPTGPGEVCSLIYGPGISLDVLVSGTYANLSAADRHNEFVLSSNGPTKCAVHSPSPRG